MSEQNITPPAPKDAEEKRYAVYDTRLLRFHGPVFNTRQAARAHAKERDIDSFEIREV